MRKRPVIRTVTFLTAAALVMGVLAFIGLRRSRSLELSARIGAQRAFDEMVTSVAELSSALEKSIYVTDPALESALCTQIFGRAVSAQNSLSALPWSAQELEHMSGFLSHVGDYACTLSRTVGGTGGYSVEELENLRSLAETAEVMCLNLQDMQARMMAGDLSMDEVYGAAARLSQEENAVPLAGTALRSMEAEFPELPTLIYDGPFSESMESPTPVYLEGMSEVDESAARAAAARFLSARTEDLDYRGDCGGDIPCRVYTAFLGGDEYTVYVTNRGGCVLSALSSRLPGRAKLSETEALAEAENFLLQQRIPDMTETYHMIQGGVLTVNYEYEQEGVLCYPDLIKIGISMDNGAVVSYDARGYLTCHRQRDMNAPGIGEGDARTRVSPALKIEKSRLALIPSQGGEERLCYEFSCLAEDGGHFLVYVNADTGAEEKILILLEDESGTLTI